MQQILFMIKVEDYAKWKADFDTEQGSAMRKQMGMREYQIFQVVDDPQKLALLTTFDDLEAAKRFEQSTELQEASKSAGVTEMTFSYFVQEIEKENV